MSMLHSLYNSKTFHKLNKEVILDKGGGSVLVWGLMGHSGVGNLAFIDGTKTARMWEMDEPVVHFPLTTHVLDVTQGVPGRNVAVSLFRQIGESWELITERFTDTDGRCPGLISAANFQVGIYKLHFDTGKYFKDNNIAGFYPFVEVVFEVKDPFSHYHVPLIISPYSYSTYRGS